MWRFWTVPAPGEPGSETWQGGGIAHPGAATWLTGTYDPELDTLYWPTGNPAAPCAAGALDEVRTAYDYGPNSGPNNLLPRGQAVTAEAGGQLVTHRTCYGYDARGRRISETQPNANLSTCP